MTERREMTEADAMLAAELALSALQGAEREEAERRMVTDPAFRAEVEMWQAGLADKLGAEIAEVPPRRALKPIVMARAFAEPVRQRRVWPWKLFGGLSFVAALLLAGFLGMTILGIPMPDPLRPFAPPPAQIVLAEIASEDRSLAVVVAYEPVAGRVQYTRVAGEAAEGRALELWAIAGDRAPVSLGLLPDTAEGVAKLPAVAAEGPLVLAISDEPPGGSPTGVPTGAVLAQGALATF